MMREVSIYLCLSERLVFVVMALCDDRKRLLGRVDGCHVESLYLRSSRPVQERAVDLQQ